MRFISIPLFENGFVSSHVKKAFRLALSSILMIALGLTALLNSGCQTISSDVTKDSKQSVNLDIERWQTSKGAEVLFIQNTALPLVDIHVSFEAGAMRDDDIVFGPEQNWHHGLAGFTSGLLGEATLRDSYAKTAQQISEAFERQGAVFSTDFGQRTAELSLRSLTGEPLTKSLEQFNEVLADAAFTQEAFERIKAQLVNYLRYMNTQPNKQSAYFYNEKFFAVLGGRAHDLARTKWGTLESIETISPKDVQAFYQRFYTNQTMQIVLTGNIDTAKAKAIAESISNTRPASAKSNSVLPLQAFVQGVSGRQHKPFEAAQTQIIMGLATIGRHDKDYAAFKLANDILGGGSTSRLYKAVRDDKGLTYSIYSRFSSVLDQGEFTISMQTAAGQADEAIDVTLQTIEAFIENGVTQQELDQSKASYRMAFSQAFTSNKGLNGALTTLARNNLQDSFYGDFLQQIEDADLPQVNAAIKRLLQKDKLLIVTLGQLKKVNRKGQ